jgi:hypothetical protein
MIGGIVEQLLKWLYGARFRTPLALILDTHAIGRGTTKDVKRKYVSSGGLSLVIMVGIFSPAKRHLFLCFESQKIRSER